MFRHSLVAFLLASSCSSSSAALTFQSSRSSRNSRTTRTSARIRLQQVLHSTRSSSNDDSTLLIPEQNPLQTPERLSTAGVAFGTVHNWLESLYPPETLQDRNAESRTDGYWPYLQKGLDPPKAYTYGEFDFYSFANLLELVHMMHDTKPPRVFTDIGSGTGRLVLAAAAMYDWEVCRGIELLNGIHTSAERIRDNVLQDDPSVLLAERVEFTCGSFMDPYVYFGDNSNVIFCFSTCMDEATIQSLGRAIGRQCQVGTIVITTDYRLPAAGEVPPEEFDDRVPFGVYEIECLQEVETWCWLLGGPSTAYIHKVTKSLHDPDIYPLSPPELPLEDRALQVIRALESGTLTDTEAFLRNVDNNIIFHGLPERFLSQKNRR